MWNVEFFFLAMLLYIWEEIPQVLLDIEQL